MRRLALLVLVLVACKKAENAPAVDPCAKAKPEGPLAWFHDDYDAALGCARQRGVPVVLDLWAPWCHTCLSMQSTVFVDPSFAPDASKFVFVALDTDRDVNARVVDKFPLSAWPTFYVIDTNENVLARFIGAASTAQFHAFLDSGARAAKGDGQPAVAGAPGRADVHLLAAERAVAAKDLATAETEVTAALAAAPADWVRRPDAFVTLIGVKNKRKDYAGCIELAEQSLDDTGNAASATDFTSAAVNCATDHLKAKPEDAPRVKALRERAIAKWRSLLDDKASPMSVDDRSDAMLYLRETLEKLDRKAEARTVAEAQRAMLDEAAAKAVKPMAAMTYNWPRAEVYAYLERPLELVGALEKSVADLPNEYDPPYRLGWIYLKAGKLDEAAKHTDRALALVYGQRKLRVLNQRAEIAAKLGDKATERAMREQIVKLHESLPAGQTSSDALAKAKQAVADLDKPTTTAN